MIKVSFRTILILAALVVCITFFAAGFSVMRLSKEIREKFDGHRWSLPAVVFARPLEVFPGLQLSPQALEEELQLCGYRQEKVENGAGSYSREGETIRLVSRDFYYSSGLEPSRHLRLTFRNNTIEALETGVEWQPLAFARIDPARIGSFHPLVHEDRIILRREDIPDLLIQTLLVIEDRKFYSHMGISPLAIIRAMTANLRAGRMVQGGSTLTQQLVKNYFLSSERTLLRKVQEAVMALLLEIHYSKDEIVTAYINEVFLGQDGDRAIHGFALASEFFFRRQLNDLRADQIAVLVGMVKGPSYFNPHRNPENCIKRRNLVLHEMVLENLISSTALQEALARPVVENKAQDGGFNRFPAFLDLVRYQLAEEFEEKDLKTSGLQIITTLDPHIQFTVEKSLEKSITAIEGSSPARKLEGAVIVTRRETAEILALSGGRNRLQGSFNRALQARRPIGSLIKPVVYLTALSRGYSLASPLEDTAIGLDSPSAPAWRPENYDHLEHGRVPLFSALVNSYNLATVRLGLALGFENVITTLHDLGYDDEISHYPSLFLGAVSMSPFQVCQMYQTIASGGFYTSLRAISSVIAADHSPLNRYNLAVEQRISPQANFLLGHALQRVVQEGTARSLLRSPLGKYNLAGKTGTSDDFRDSWFAGFSGDHVAVVWLGRDDNNSTFLTGAAGGMRVWAAVMENIHTSPLDLVAPPGILWESIDLTSFHQSGRGNLDSTLLPFISENGKPDNHAPGEVENTFPEEEGSIFKKIKNLFQ